MTTGKIHRLVRRAGFGLFELLVAMILFTAALTLFVVFLELVLKVGTGSSEHLDRLVVTSRLARALRDDVHAATLAELADGPQAAASGGDPTRLRLRLADDRWIEYSVERDRVRREQIDGGSTKQREEYPLDRSAGGWTIDRLSGGTIVALRINRRLSPRRSSAPRPVRIEAVLAFDHRLETGGTP
jgi:hypothetical protein